VTLVVFAVAVTVFVKSDQGDRFVHFLKETRIELRKVVWPTRPETIKTTGIIMVAVVIVAIFLWIIDAFFTWGVQSISSINIF
jgi:preprotein translocase subunit SecE